MVCPTRANLSRACERPGRAFKVCKTCIVLYLQTSNFCPVCDVLIHKTRPLAGVIPDRILQDLVYKLVPGLFGNELKRRREFYTANPDLDPGGNLMAFPGEETRPGAVGSQSPSDRSSSDASDDRYYTEEEQISVALEFSADGRPVGDSPPAVKPPSSGGALCRPPPPRFLLCPAPFTIRLLKKFVRDKYGLPPQFQIEVFYSEESLNDNYTLMDVAYIYTWQRSGPLRLFYSIYNNGDSEVDWSSMDTPSPPSSPGFSPPSTPPLSPPCSPPPALSPLGDPPPAPPSPGTASSTESTPDPNAQRMPFTTTRVRSVRFVDKRRVVREALKFTIKPREGVIRRSSSSSSSTETVTETTTCTETRTRTIRRKRVKLSHTLRRKLRRLEANDDHDLLSEKLSHLKLPVDKSQKAHSEANNFLRVENDQSCRWEIRNFSFRCGEASSSTSASPASTDSSPRRADQADWTRDISPRRPFVRQILPENKLALTVSPQGDFSRCHSGQATQEKRTLSFPALPEGKSVPTNTDLVISPQTVPELMPPPAVSSLPKPKGPGKSSLWKRPLHFSPPKSVQIGAVSSIQGICLTNPASRPKGFMGATSGNVSGYSHVGSDGIACASGQSPLLTGTTKALALHSRLTNTNNTSRAETTSLRSFGKNALANTTMTASHVFGMSSFSALAQGLSH